MTNDEIVTRFCEAFVRLDADELIEYFNADATYHNIPMPILKGRDAIHAYLKAVPSRIDKVEFETLRQVSSGDIVMNERIDYLTMGERRVALPVAGVFEMRGGRIQAWRDYFDVAMFKGA